MDVRIAVLADFASISLDHKLNILGIFSRIFAVQTPVIHPQFKLVLQLEFKSGEAGEKHLEVELIDEDGEDLIAISGKLVVESTLDGRSSQVNQILDFTGLTFPKFGEYEFRISVNGHLVCEIPLTVAQVTVAAVES